MRFVPPTRVVSHLKCNVMFIRLSSLLLSIIYDVLCCLKFKTLEIIGPMLVIELRLGHPMRRDLILYGYEIGLHVGPIGLYRIILYTCILEEFYDHLLLT